MKDTALRQALRDVRDVATRSGVWVTLAAIIAALGISGPFGTIDSLTLIPRFFYWAVTVITTTACGWLASRWLLAVLHARGVQRPARIALVLITVSVVVACDMALVNWLIRGRSPFTVDALIDLALSTVPIALVVAIAFTWGHRSVAPAAESPATPAPPRLLARLPFDKRGPLVSLSVQDHYVEITTLRGRELVLMRLGDAIAEAEGCQGLQVHRSHWVALDQVRGARRDGARGVLTLSDGREIPVSRSYVPDAKEAGLL